MNIHCPWLLLTLGQVALFDSWTVHHPQTIFAWEGACVWIPCQYKRLNRQVNQVHKLEKVLLYQNYTFDNNSKDFKGIVLYNDTKMESSPSKHGRVTFHGDRKDNCTLEIHPIHANDSGQLGLRMVWGEDKWMEHVSLNISATPFPPYIMVPTEIQASQSVTLTCRLNFACFGYPVHLEWSLKKPETTTTSTTTTVKNVYTESNLTFHPEWMDHGKNVTCQVLHSTQVLSENTVRLDVKHAPKLVTTVIENDTPIREGDSVTLACRYNSSNPKVTSYLWSHLDSGSQITSGVLRIEKVPWDFKSVSCAACNHWCSWASPVSLNVHYAPRDVKIRKSNPWISEIHAGQYVHLWCSSSGSHPAEVRYLWKKNGRFVQEGRDLNFSSISPEDSGSYKCMANNSIGETLSESWDLRVLYAPRRLRVSISPGDSVMEGKMATLSCVSDANPPILNYVWYDSSNRPMSFSGQKLTLEPLKVQHTGSYRCLGRNRLGESESPPSTLTVYYSPETIGKRAALGLGFCLAICILAIWGMKLHKKWKGNQSQQGFQENSSGQSFFVRNKKTRRNPLSEDPQPQGCHNPMMDDNVSYAILRFPETDTPRAGDARTSATLGPPNIDDTVTYSVIQKRHVDDYENVTPSCPEDDSIHYSELVQFGAGKRPEAKEEVEYVTLKH
ncbi:B-cell receptor CD22 isoform X2 [Phodopus roborovskii]|uniref:B-cell receptor CD22 isoform X2 n=1 Tax=Phodopus roborovskii TaxID=109678 RepID=UPI0021E4C5A8|nr:B-cell receptor CD22 isoform X2 [Phodopus roborovskii]